MRISDWSSDVCSSDLSDLEAVSGIPVHRAWDIGVRDDTSIWWFQVVGTQIFILDCWSQPGVSDIAEFASMIKAKDEEHGWNIGLEAVDYVPHAARKDRKSVV